MPSIDLQVPTVTCSWNMLTASLQSTSKRNWGLAWQPVIGSCSNVFSSLREWNSAVPNQQAYPSAQHFQKNRCFDLYFREYEQYRIQKHSSKSVVTLASVGIIHVTPFDRIHWVKKFWLGRGFPPTILTECESNEEIFGLGKNGHLSKGFCFTSASSTIFEEDKNGYGSLLKK